MLNSLLWIILAGYLVLFCFFKRLVARRASEKVTHRYNRQTGLVEKV